jgi:hypothetical protein
VPWTRPDIPFGTLLAWSRTAMNPRHQHDEIQSGVKNLIPT